MPRRVRMEYEGAVYHVMDRGNRLEAIFLDDEDREMFLKTLGQGCARAGFRIHSYVLMSNHHHLLLETPEANISRGMQWIQSTYTIRHNARHRKRGHLFQGRYKAILVDPESETYFRTVSDYIPSSCSSAKFVNIRSPDKNRANLDPIFKPAKSSDVRTAVRKSAPHGSARIGF